MKKIKTLILRTAGTNCDKETAYSFELAGSEADLLHINRLIENGSRLDKYHILAIPGGFTYGDDVASGKILANELKFNLKRHLQKFISAGKLVIGICNGFQVLVKMGLLPNVCGGKDLAVEATLSLNDSGKFDSRWVYLKGQGSGVKGHGKCVWTRGLPRVIYLPIAHAEGKFIPEDKSLIKKLKENGQIVFQYTDKKGEKGGYPHNPNGSVGDIAGLCDTSGRIFGLMPHPERHISYLQHPNWRRYRKRTEDLGDGINIFKNGVNFARENLC